MVNRFRSVKALVLALAAALVLSGCVGAGVGGGGGSGDGPITLKYAFFAPAGSFPAKQMEEWKTRLEAQTNGAVKVELYPGGTLLGAGDIYDGVSNGIVDIGLDSPAYDTGRFPFSSVINLPVGFTNSQVPSATFWDLLTEYQPAEFSKYRVITAFTTEPAYLQTKRPVTSRDELARMELRAAGAQLPVLGELGAAPAAMPMPEVSQNLQTGVVAGYLSSREVLKDFGLADQVSYITDYPFGVSNSFVAVMDADRFRQLPEPVRAAILDLGPQMSQWAANYHDQINVAESLQAAADNRVQTVQLTDREAWDSVAHRQVDQWIARQSDLDGARIVGRMRELQQQHGPKG